MLWRQQVLCYIQLFHGGQPELALSRRVLGNRRKPNPSISAPPTREEGAFEADARRDAA